MILAIFHVEIVEALRSRTRDPTVQTEQQIREVGFVFVCLLSPTYFGFLKWKDTWLKPDYLHHVEWCLSTLANFFWSLAKTRLTCQSHLASHRFGLKSCRKVRCTCSSQPLPPWTLTTKMMPSRTVLEIKSFGSKNWKMENNGKTMRKMKNNGKNHEQPLLVRPNNAVTATWRFQEGRPAGRRMKGRGGEEDDRYAGKVPLAKEVRPWPPWFVVFQRVKPLCTVDNIYI